MNRIIKSLIKNLGLLAIIVLTSYFLSPFFGLLFKFISKDSSIVSGYIGLAGIPLAYIFFLISGFVVFGSTGKYWWILVSIVPMAIFMYKFDYANLSTSFVIVGILGWLLGLGIQKVIVKAKS